MTMDYSSCPKREFWPFLRVAVSPKPRRSHPPKLVYMHVTSTPTCMNFLSRFRLIDSFDDHGLQSMVRKGNLAVHYCLNFTDSAKCWALIENVSLDMR